MNNNEKHSNLQRVLLKVCAVLCAILLTINPVKANAMNPVLPIPPIWLPINPYNTESIVPNAELLNDEQKNILYDIIGAYNHIYLGFGGFVLTNPVLGVRQWWNEYGETFYNSFVQSVVGSPRAIIDMVGSATYKASQYETEQEFLDEISDTTISNYLQYNPELTFAFRDWYFNRGGVYNWQIQTKPFETTIHWKNRDLGGNALTYNTYLQSFQNKIKGDDNVYLDNSYFFNMYFDIEDKYDLFINTSTSQAYFVNGQGQIHETTYVDFLAYYYVSSAYQSIIYKQNIPLYFSSINITAFNYSDIVDLVNQLINPPTYRYRNKLLCCNDDEWVVPGTRNSSPRFPFFGQIINKVYAGLSWGQRQEVFNIDDLDIGNSNSAYIDNVGNDAFTDINGLYTSLGVDVTDIKEGVFENTLVKTQDDTGVEQLTQALVDAIDKFQTTPDSGIVIPSGIFTPVKGFMEYMWYMTKPLIVFTNNIIETLTFGASDGFLNTGPSIFIFGVVAFGLIGGLVVKCLL